LKNGFVEHREDLPANLTQQQENVLVGSMLGDGCLRKRKENWNASLTIQRAQKDLDYLKWEAKVFENFLTETGIKCADRFDKRNQKIYQTCWFTSAAKSVLNPFEKCWYESKNGSRKKVVPNDLKLNSEIIAVWFCDDGTIGTSSSANRLKISFATNSFAKDEVIFLRDLLNDRYNEDWTISKTNKEGQFTLHGSDSASRTLISDIDSVFPEGMQRKRLWDRPESCFYANQPKPEMSRIRSVPMRQKQVLDFLETREEFSLVDLAKEMDWKFNRSNGRVEWDTQNVRRYLDPHVKNGTVEFIRKDKNGFHFRKIKQL
jgi:hypothetical protein